MQINLGRALTKKGRYAEAVEDVRAGLAARPDIPGAHNILGVSLMMLGQDAEAESAFRQELRVNPQSAKTHLNLGRLMLKHRDFVGATRYLSRAVRLQPSDAESHILLADALSGAGKPGEAIRHYREALRLRPNNPVPANAMAWMLSTNPDPAVRSGKEAVAVARFACQMTQYRDPAMLDTLAAAYAEAGRFADAVEIASKAVARAESMKDASLADQFRTRLSLYRSHRAYREPRQ